MTTRSYKLTDRQVMIVQAALSAQLRYSQRLLDRAKEDDAVNNNARWCVEIGAVRRVFS